MWELLERLSLFLHNKKGDDFTMIDELPNKKIEEMFKELADKAEELEKEEEQDSSNDSLVIMEMWQ